LATDHRPHEGTLSSTTFPSLVYSILRRGDTGVLAVRDGPIEKSLFVRDGRPLFAASTDLEDRLGALYLKAGRVPLTGVLAAVEKSATGKKRLGTILVEMGLIQPEVLVEGVLAQVKGIILSLFQWTRGHYAYKPGPLPTDELITLKLNADRIILEGVLGIDRWERVWEAVGPLDAQYQIVEGAADRLKGIGPPSVDPALLARLDRPATVQDLCGLAKMKDFDLCRLLWALRTLGIVKRV
jgi:hypothetical protein